MKTQLIFVFFIGIFCFNCYSQKSNKQYYPLKLVQYESNVNAPFSAHEMVQLKEVYGASIEKEILSRPNRVLSLKNLLRNRILIRNMPNLKDHKKYILLSKVPIFDAFVSTLQRDFVFNLQEFNPLKYAFSFYSRGEHMYRVDGTDYFIFVKSQHYKKLNRWKK